MDNSGLWWYGRRLETSMCHFLLWTPLSGYNICLIKGDTVFSDAFVCDHQFCYYPFQQGQSSACSDSATLFLQLAQPSLTVINEGKSCHSFDWREWHRYCSVFGSLALLRLMQRVLLIAQSDALFLPTLISWHSEKQLRLCAVWTWCCFGH